MTEPQYRIMFDHLETDVTGWVVCELIPGFKFDSHDEAKEALARIKGEGRSPASQGQAGPASPEAPAGLRHSGTIPNADDEPAWNPKAGGY